MFMTMAEKGLTVCKILLQLCIGSIYFLVGQNAYDQAPITAMDIFFLQT